MRIPGRLLAIVTIAALLAPGVRWVSSRIGVEACACPPAACMCPGHHHTLGHTVMCSLANGGQCGLSSPDDFLNSLLGTLIFIPTAGHRFPDAQQIWDFNHSPLHLTPLPSHTEPPEQPPRLAL